MRIFNSFLLAAVMVLAAAVGWLVWDRRENRPCLGREKRIMLDYNFPDGDSSIGIAARRLYLAKMYAELAKDGCPEHSAEYAQKSEREVQQFKNIVAQETAGIGAEFKIDMQKFQDAVNEVADSARQTIESFIDKVKDTKINITIE